MATPKILLIYTGGTIGMIIDAKTKALKPFSIERILKEVDDIKKLKVSLSAISLEKIIDSADMKPTQWVTLSRLITDNYNDYDGFVVLHGTDTMAYTASAVSFLLENLGKPVVFTGSQLPIGVLRSDGRENLITAIEIAAHKTNDNPTVTEVAVCFKNQLYRGNRSHKINSELFEAFNSINYPKLAEAGVDINFNQSALMPKPILPFKSYTKLVDDIAILKLFPGISPQLVEATLGIPNLKGLILETYGAGNAPSGSWFINPLKKAINKGLIVMNVTQCYGGSVEQGKYETSRALNSIGVISGFDITTEAAVAKLMYLLANTDSKDELLEKLNSPLRGEMTL